MTLRASPGKWFLPDEEEPEAGEAEAAAAAEKRASEKEPCRLLTTLVFNC